jgi:uncharacterized protein (TIGR00369 family)
MKHSIDDTSPAELRAMSGLRMLEAVQASRLKSSGIAHTMPMRLTGVRQGDVGMSVRPDARHLNPAGRVQGGFAATCLDGAAALALFSALDVSTPYSTVDLNVKYVRPLDAEVDYVAIGRLIEKTRSIGVCAAEIRGQDGKLYGLASATLMIGPT